VIDKHLGILCKQHLETKFVKVCARVCVCVRGTAGACLAAAPHQRITGSGCVCGSSVEPCAVTHPHALCSWAGAHTPHTGARTPTQINAEKAPYLTEKLKVCGGTCCEQRGVSGRLRGRGVGA
jgi:hypothetical protein